MKRWWYLIGLYLAAVIIFIAGKFAFMAHNAAAELKELPAVVSHGLTLDLSTSLYCIILPFLVIVASFWIARWQPIRKVLKVYHLLLAVALTLAIGSDLVMYGYWGIKLDASMLQFLEQPSGITQSVSMPLLVAMAAAFCLCIFVIYRLFNLLLPKDVQRLALKSRIASTVAALLLVPVIIIGIRGGLGESTTNVGQTYFSQKQLLNHSAVNPLFSFLASFEKSANNIEEYPFMADDEAAAIVDSLYNKVEGATVDSLLTTRRPNIVIVLLESCGALFTRLEGRTDIMPRFNQLMDEGVLFANCYGNTWRTDRGTVCTLGGYPSFPRSSVMKQPKKTAAMPAIAKSLLPLGYKSRFLYGGDINFTNMRSYLVNAGFEELMSMDDYSREERKTAQWGVRDDITFKTVGDMIEQTPEPFIIGYSTLSSHEPWDVPVKKLDDEVENAFYYLDQCIGSFVERMKKSQRWDNLLLIFVPDHSINHGGYDETKAGRNHIPMLWIGGAVKEPRRIEAICNQTDLAATLLSQLGIDHTAFTFSRDVMSSAYTQPFAVHNYTDGFSMVDTTGFVVYDLNANKLVVSQSPSAAEMERKGKAILQVTCQDFKKK